MSEAGDHLATADVYAGDNGQGSSGESRTNVFLFEIQADAEPDVLARVANLLNLANEIPLSAHLQRKSAEHVYIEVTMERITTTMADMIRRKLLQLTCVISVELVVQSTHLPSTT